MLSPLGKFAAAITLAGGALLTSSGSAAAYGTRDCTCGERSDAQMEADGACYNALGFYNPYPVWLPMQCGYLVDCWYDYSEAKVLKYYYCYDLPEPVFLCPGIEPCEG